MKNYPLELRRDSDTSMTLDPTRLLLAFKEPHTLEDLAPPLQPLGLALEEGDRREPINHTDRRFWIRTNRDEAIDDKLYDAITDTFGEQLDWIGPVYQLAETPGRAGRLCPLPNVLMIKTRQGYTADSSRIMRQPPLREDSKRSQYLGGYRYYVIDNPQDNSSYQLQRQLLESESQLFEQVFLESMPMLVPLSQDSVDPLYPNQWNMFKIEAGGPGTTGWNFTIGVETVTIAIIDSGCDLTHPDLYYRNQGFNLGTLLPSGAPIPSPSGFHVGHGTAVAGIAAAINNNLKGVAGVAGGCTLMPFAFMNFTEAELSWGIFTAVQQGARVINMSFNSTVWSPEIVNPAIEWAYANNVIMCASTGNTGGALIYPSTHPHVIACGATVPNDTRAIYPIIGGASNFGTGLSVVAPGRTIWTTDIQGSAGFGTMPGGVGDYIIDFYGTSAAAPHVSGLAALILSINSAFTSDEVRNIIERSADKVGGYTYEPNHPNGSWNEEMGYGRINVLRALRGF